MTLGEVKTILDAQLLCGEELLEQEVHTACGSDLMSDVLAFVKDQAVLLTGLMNQQVVRTAEMMDILCIIFVRGKEPAPEVVELNRDVRHIVQKILDIKKVKRSCRIERLKAM